MTGLCRNVFPSNLWCLHFFHAFGALKSRLHLAHLTVSVEGIYHLVKDSLGSRSDYRCRGLRPSSSPGHAGTGRRLAFRCLRRYASG